MSQIRMSLLYVSSFPIFAGQALGGYGTHEQLDIELGLELMAQRNMESDGLPANEFSASVESDLSLRFYDRFSVEAGIVLEPIDSSGFDRNRPFDDHGIFFEQLFAQYQAGPVTVFGGKFNPTFGVAWDQAHGVFGPEPAEDLYQQVERIGFGSSVEFGDDTDGGSSSVCYLVTVQTFFADTTVLSGSIVNNRGVVSEADGGAANTNSLSSFSTTLDGHYMRRGDELFGYSLGFLRKAAGVTETENEVGASAAVFGGFDATGSLRIEPLLEYAYFDGAEGLDQNRHVVTASTAFVAGPWDTGLSYTKVRNRQNAPLTGPSNFQQGQISIGYSFRSGIYVDVGYKYTREKVNQIAKDAHFIATRLQYNFDFGISGKGISRL